MNQRPKTIREIEKISDPGLHNIGGVPGLYLRVTESGRYYIFRYVENGKRSALSLGNAKRVTLAEARKMALRYRIALDAGKSIRRLRKTAEPQSVTSVNRLAEKWLKSKEAAGYWKENKRGSRDRFNFSERKGLWKKSVSLLIRPQERGRKFCRYET